MAQGGLQLLLDQRNYWEQTIKLELFPHSKDIFRDSLPTEASRKQVFTVTPNAVTPVPLYEFELRELFVEATVKSGCKWWCRRSKPSRAKQRLRVAQLWSVTFICRHSGNDFKKQETDNSRDARHLKQCGCPASCKLKAISVRMNATNSMQCFPFLYTTTGRSIEQRPQVIGDLFSTVMHRGIWQVL